MERRDSGRLFWRRDASKVRFRYEVEVLEYEKDPSEHLIDHTDGGQKSNSAVFVAATCMAALAITVLLPWFLIGGGVGS